MARGAPSGRKTSPESIEAKERAAAALKLRLKGMTFEAIAKELGYSCKQSAYDAVSRSIKSITREPAEELIRLDLERLDALWYPQYEKAVDGDPIAMSACIKLMERRAKLLGLDRPVQQEIKHTVKEEDLSHLSAEELEEIKMKLYGNKPESQVGEE